MYKKLILLVAVWGLLSNAVFANHRDENSKIIAVGEYGTILSSQNGALWKEEQNLTQQMLISAIYFNHQYVVLGYRFFLTSNDGVNWVFHDVDSSFSPYHNLTIINGKLWAMNSSWGAIYSSENGIDWKQNYMGYPDRYNSIAWGKGTYVSVSGTVSSQSCDGGVITSQDGNNWTRVNIPSQCAWNVIWGNNEFMAIGQQGGYDQPIKFGVLTSQDGTQWAWHPLEGNNQYLASVVWANNQYVAVGIANLGQAREGAIYASKDGVNWAQRFADKPIKGLHSVTWVNRQFIALGDSGTIVTSSDGVKWTVQNSGVDVDLNSVAANNNE